jgi:hypothetical protein
VVSYVPSRSPPAYGPMRTPGPSRGGSTFTGLVELLPVTAVHVAPSAEYAAVRLLPSRINRTYAVVGKSVGTMFCALMFRVSFGGLSAVISK